MEIFLPTSNLQDIWLALRNRYYRLPITASCSVTCCNNCDFTLTLGWLYIDVVHEDSLTLGDKKVLVLIQLDVNSFYFLDRHRSSEQLWSSVFCCCRPVDLEFAADSLRDPALSLNIFRRQLKTHFFCEILTRCTERIRDFLRMRYINLHFTY